MIEIEKYFADKLKEVFFYIARYGAAKEYSLHKEAESFNYKRFITLCNDGFKIGQNLVLDELRILEGKRKEIEEGIKQKRIEKKEGERKNLEQVLRVHKYKEELLRNLIYTIAWQLFNGKREILARFYTDEKGNNQLSGKGFEGILSVAAEINKDPEKFALISDLTNNIQIGDLLVITPEGHEVIEVKTGEKNEAAKRLMNFYAVNDIEVTEEKVLQSFDKKFAMQLLRMQKQERKTERLKRIIEEDSGSHPKYEDTEVNLIESPIIDETFHEEIAELLKKLDEKDWACTSIWGVINVGAYKNDWRIKGKFALQALNNGYHVHDVVPLGVNLSEPIFAKPIYWGDQNIIDLALGKIKVYIGIDFDKFVKFANDFGLPMRWSTRKELNRFFDLSGGGINNREIFSHENRGLIIEDEETKGSLQFVGFGMIFRMIHDHVNPSTLVRNRAIAFEKFKENLKNKS